MEGTTWFTGDILRPPTMCLFVRCGASEILKGQPDHRTFKVSPNIVC